MNTKKQLTSFDQLPATHDKAKAMEENVDGLSRPSSAAAPQLPTPRNGVATGQKVATAPAVDSAAAPQSPSAAALRPPRLRGESSAAARQP
jgi:hypothetical protein